MICNFQITGIDINEPNNYNENIEIYIWGINKKNNKVLLIIDDFIPYYYIKLPTSTYWNKGKLLRFVDEIGSRIIKPKLIFNESLNNNKLLPYLKCQIPNKICVYQIKKKLENGINFSNQIIKTTINELFVSIERKFVTSLEIEYCSWIQINENLIIENEKISYCKYEFKCSYNNICLIPEKICKNWNTAPTILAFDIEAYSDNPKKMPNKYLYNNECFMISCVYKKYKYENVKRIGIVIGDCFENHNSMNEINIEKIIKVNNEVELIRKFSELIHQIDPDIITGFNIFGFDLPYLWYRLNRTGNEWYPCSRLKDFKINKIISKFERNGSKIYYPIIPGRIFIDFYNISKSLWKRKSYSLNNIAKDELNKSKLDVNANEMFYIYENLNETREKLINENNLDVDDKLIWDKINKEKNLELIKNYENWVNKYSKVMAYCFIDSDLVVELLEKINQWEAIISFSNIIGCTPQQLFSEKSEFKCISQLYDICKKNEKNYILDQRQKNKDITTVKGGYVFDPIQGIHKNILILDFNSLYPSNIIMGNFCYTTLIDPENYDKYDEKDVNIIKFEQEEKINDEIVIKNYEFRFLKPHIKKGLLPILMTNRINDRKNVKNQIKLLNENDIFQKNILDQRQLAIKLSANSFYGILSMFNGKISCLEIATSITGLGRNCTKKVANYIENEHNGVVVYGDTDSVMVDVHIKPNQNSYEVGDMLCDLIHGVKKGDKKPNGELYEKDQKGLFSEFEIPLKMECERKVDILTITKKKYYCVEYDRNTNKPIMDPNNKKSFKFYGKGGPTIRRDSSKIMNQIYEGLLQLIFKEKNIIESLTFLFNEINKILNGENVDINDFVSTKKLGSHYKSENSAMKLFYNRLCNDGKYVTPGERLSFLISDREGKLGEKYVLLEEYYEEGSNIKIDFMYYLEKLIKNPIDQLLYIVYKNDLDKLKEISIKLNEKGKPIDITNPLKMYLTMIKYDFETNDLIEIIKKNYYHLFNH